MSTLCVRPLRAWLAARSNAAVTTASLFAGLVAWEVIAAGQASFVLASPHAVALRFWYLCASLELPRALGGALLHMLLGYTLSVGIAVPLGLLMARNRFVFDLLDPVVNLIYAVPSIAWAPFIIIWCGLYYEARVVLVVLMCTFDMIIVVSAGGRDISRGTLAVGRSFGASRRQMVWLVLLPAALPCLFTALRIGIVRAVNAMITAELFLAAVNLGSMMKRASVRLDSATVLAVLVLLSLLGLGLQEAVLLIERRVCTWQPGTRK